MEKLNVLEWRNGGRLLKLDTKTFLESIHDTFLCSIMQQMELLPQAKELSTPFLSIMSRHTRMQIHRGVRRVRRPTKLRRVDPSSV